MKIIKCGGTSLANYEDRIKIYNQIKKSDEKTILIVSAFANSPYSTKSLKSLLKDNYDYYMKEQLITLGEIISSIKVTNELLNEYIDASLIYIDELGIKVNSYENNIEIFSLDNSKILDKINNHKVVVIPGFIAINQDNKIVSLKENGSDLTAIIVAKMLEINDVYLYKDVLGLSSIDPSISSSYKLYEKVSYDNMLKIISHGNSLVQYEAVKLAKENNINIHILHYLNQSQETLISKVLNVQVTTFSLLDNDVYIDGYTDINKIENILILKNIKYDYLLPCNGFIKIATSYNNSLLIINTLHNLYLKGEL